MVATSSCSVGLRTHFGFGHRLCRWIPKSCKAVIGDLSLRHRKQNRQVRFRLPSAWLPPLLQRSLSPISFLSRLIQGDAVDLSSEMSSRPWSSR